MEPNLEDNIESESIRYSALKKIGSGIINAFTNVAAAAILLSIAGYAGLTCYQTFPGEEENTTVTKREVREEIDFDGVPMGIDTYIFRIDKDKRCLEIRDFSNGYVGEGDVIKYISWKFNPRPWRCNVVDEYKK